MTYLRGSFALLRICSKAKQRRKTSPPGLGVLGWRAQTDHGEADGDTLPEGDAARSDALPEGDRSSRYGALVTQSARPAP